MKKDHPPLLRQYKEVKRRFPDELLLFRMGDFYEFFYDDAEVASRALDITLTSKPLGKNIRAPLAGIPVKAAESYISRLLSKGYKVAICEQTGEGDRLMKREVVEVITPGTVFSPSLLEEKRSNYISSLMPEGERVGVAFLEVTTGEFFCMETDLDRGGEELVRFEAAEVLVPDGSKELNGSFVLTELSPERFDLYLADEELKRFFCVKTLEGFGLESHPLARRAAGALLSYVSEKKNGMLSHIRNLRLKSDSDYLSLDPKTVKNLELVEKVHPESFGMTLLQMIDRTRTPMGGRHLRESLLSPFARKEPIQRRQMRVETLVGDNSLLASLQGVLKGFSDVERIVSRVSAGKANPREVRRLSGSLRLANELRKGLEDSLAFRDILDDLPDMTQLALEIERTVSDDPPAKVSDGGIIREGVSSELDELRDLAHGGKETLMELEARERERTGIASLRVRYNSVFGYYIEVTKANLHLVPPDYVRKQTLTNAERYITDELKELEERITRSEERAQELETKIWRELCERITKGAMEIERVGRCTAEIDLSAALADLAVSKRYVKPDIVETGTLLIRDGRHPVVEGTIQDPFIPNDTEMDLEENRLFIITGPNMSGKSTYLRQVALICVLAQMGSFVPAKEARIGLVDRVFTRIGASDDVSRGVSTFMAEMLETAQILRSATERSLILLDEIGRGTSTYDGMAIAWAVAEYMNAQIGAKILFATHYHELSELGKTVKGIRNYTVQVKEWEDRVIFLRKVIPGESDRSYGVYVAELAGMPKDVTKRAREVLADLEKVREMSRPKGPKGAQLNLFGAEDPLRTLFKELETNRMTPLDALNLVHRIKDEMIE
jgi:DNA mismatch repair protein MutS